MKKLVPVLATVLALSAVAPIASAQFIGENAPRSQADRIEMPMTDLLNRLSAMGFAQYRSINRVGDVYVIEAMTRDLQLVTLEADTRTGQIRQIQ